MNVMSWLRPEIMTSEVTYGFVDVSKWKLICRQKEMGDNICYQETARFDPAGFYEAI